MTSDFWIGVQQPSAAAKGWTAVVGTVLGTIIYTLSTNALLFPVSWQPWIPPVVMALTAISVYFVPNAPIKSVPPSAADPERYRNPWRPLRPGG